MALFTKGQPKIGGRRKGSRDKIATALLEAIAKDFEHHGEEVVRIARVERPTEYLKVVASLLPKEFEITDQRLKDIPDDELDALIEIARRRISASLPRDAADGKETPLN
jgi:transcriptional/translational regulatory protein YebC/TACO1